MKNIIISAFIVFFSAFSFSANAGYVENVNVKSLYGSKFVSFGYDGPDLSDTCSFWNRRWRFDTTTDEGKTMLKILLTAVASNRKVILWYHTSAAQGTNHTNGCLPETLAVVYGIGIMDE